MNKNIIKGITDSQRFPNLFIDKKNVGVWIIKIDRPLQKNAVNPDTAQELAEVFLEFNKTPSAKVAILTGTNKTFCSGYDLQSLNQQKVSTLKQQQNNWLDFNNLAPMGLSRLQLKKPVIAAVEGYAVAGGLELSLWCDLIVSHKESVFGVFCRRFGVPLIDGGTVRLHKIIGLNRAKDMILTGRPVSGQEAYEWGLVNRLVDTNDQVLPKAIELAQQIMQHPENCMLNDKKSLFYSAYPNFEKDMMTEMMLGLQTLQSGETLEGARRFSVDKVGRGGNFKDTQIQNNNINNNLKPKL